MTPGLADDCLVRPGLRIGIEAMATRFELVLSSDDERPLPAPEFVAEARSRVGYEYVRLDARASTIRFARQGMGLDLGAVGKGYAIGEAIAILRAHGCTSALLHGGTSSLHAIGQ